MPFFFQVKPELSEKKNRAGLQKGESGDIEIEGPEGNLELWYYLFL